jgi:uncharacterized protein YodC (DUF2158 family)
MAFEIGTVVQLKSGGPMMTVEGTSDDVISCIWMNGPVVQRAQFETQTLR